MLGAWFHGDMEEHVRQAAKNWTHRMLLLAHTFERPQADAYPRLNHINGTAEQWWRKRMLHKLDSPRQFGLGGGRQRRLR